jgi:protein-tyrosine-phosphatase
VIDERGFDLRDRIPRKTSKQELADCENVVTMGYTAEGVCPAAWSETSIDWGRDDPKAMELDAVRELHDVIDASCSQGVCSTK